MAGSLQLQEMPFSCFEKDWNVSLEKRFFLKLFAQSTKLENYCCQIVAQNACSSVLVNSLLSTFMAIGARLLFKNLLRGGTRRFSGVILLEPLST